MSGFDVRTGEVTSPPATEPVPVYDVRVESGKVLVSTRPTDGGKADRITSPTPG